MATETLPITGTTTPDDWTLSAGASKVAAVAADDGDTSYLSSGTADETQQQGVVGNAVVIASTDTINSVTIRATCKRGGANNANYVVTAVLGASTTEGATRTSTSTYAQTSDVFATKPGGGAWTLADVQAMEVRIRNTQARDVRCTQWDVVVDYTPVATGPSSRATLLGAGR